MSKVAEKTTEKFERAGAEDSRDVISRNRSSEMFFAVVGPVGAGGSRVIEVLKRVCEEAGYSPRMYTRAFEETWRLKDKITGDYKVEAPEWGDEWSPFTAGYPELEAALTG